MKRLGLLFFIMGLAACSGSSDSPDPGVPNPVDPPVASGCVPADMVLVDFQDVNAAVFAETCTRCHSGAGAPAGIDTSNFAGVKANLNAIFNSIETGRMPRGGPPVSNDNINLVAAWINIGAPERLDDLTICEE